MVAEPDRLLLVIGRYAGEGETQPKKGRVFNEARPIAALGCTR